MSILVFIIIGLLVGELGVLFLERKGWFSIRYTLTALALATLIGQIVTLFSKGISGFFMVTPGAVIAATIAALIGIFVLKATAKPLNKETDADIPWDKGGKDDNESKDSDSEKESESNDNEDIQKNQADK